MSSEGSESDIEMPIVSPKKPIRKMPKSPTEEILQNKEIKKVTIKKTTDDPKKLSTKEMVHQALTDLKSRKGVSLYAIKKYLTEKYCVDTSKSNYYIKKYIKTALEDGSIVQTKGVGASGSFKLVTVKEKKKKPKSNKKMEKENSSPSKKVVKPKKLKEKSKKTGEKSVKTKTKSKDAKSDEKPKKIMKKMDSKEKSSKEKADGAKEKKRKPKTIAKGIQTPAKKRGAMMKRKSIGSIIKPPKMKPKAKA